METNANYFNIGLFALLALAVGVVWMIRFGDIDNKDGYKTYRVEFEGSIQGLGTGSQVTYNGLPVGRVGHISLGSLPDKVDVLIDVNNHIKLYKNTNVSLTYRGITGLASVEIKGQGGISEEILPVSEDPRAFITARGSVVQDVVDGTRVLIERMTTIANRVDAIIDSNDTNLERTVLGLARLSEVLGENSERLVSFLSTSEGFVKKLDQIVISTETLISRVSDILDDNNKEAIKTIIGNTSLALQDIRDASAQIKQGTSFLENMLTSVIRGAEDISTVARKSDAILSQIDEEEIGQAISNIGAFSEDIKISGQNFNQMSDNFRVTSEKSKELADSLIKFIEPIQQELDKGGAESLFFEIIGSVRAIGKAAGEIAIFTANTNQGLGVITSRIQEVVRNINIAVRNISYQVISALERFERDPQSLFLGNSRPAYSGGGGQ